jgi:nitrite reductase (NADH) small subunit
MSWIRVTDAASVPLREGRAVKLGSEEVAIFNVGDRFLAVGNRCPHKGGPLADGIVSGDVVVCPLHAWKICLSSGKVKQPAETRACITSYPVKVVDGVVVVNIPAGEEAAAA